LRLLINFTGEHVASNGGISERLNALTEIENVHAKNRTVEVYERYASWANLQVLRLNSNKALSESSSKAVMLSWTASSALSRSGWGCADFFKAMKISSYHSCDS
jgi:hypothetical protein